jgi:N-acetylmuramoyl-L-alanine amidase
MKKIESVRYLIVHHSERELDFPGLVRFRHRFIRGWEEIGYHYLIGNGYFLTRDGEIYKGRDERMEGAHTLGYNPIALGICLLGNRDQTPPSKKQLETLMLLLLTKKSEYGITTDNVLGHNEIPGVNKSCPGKLVDMEEIRRRISR